MLPGTNAQLEGPFLKLNQAFNEIFVASQKKPPALTPAGIGPPEYKFENQRQQQTKGNAP